MINIAEILKDCPKGTKLYSPICGECEFDCVTPYLLEYDIRCIAERDCSINFDEFGRSTEYDGGECLLFPSKENRDWSTFKLTPEFKKGDFVVSVYGTIAILNGEKPASDDNWVICAVTEYNEFFTHFNLEVERYATEAEKQVLLSAINENGYIWDEEKLDLRKKEYQFKPFDKVLVRYTEHCEWCTDLFSHIKNSEKEKYCCIGGNWKYCIPYEGNEHLLGTSNSPK